MQKKQIAVWNLQVPKALDEAVVKAINTTCHMTKAEFIREAVREKLRIIKRKSGWEKGAQSLR